MTPAAASHHGSLVTLADLEQGYLPDGVDLAGKLRLFDIETLIRQTTGSDLPAIVAGTGDAVTAAPLARTSDGTGHHHTRLSRDHHATLGVDLLRVPAGADFPPHVHPGHHLLYVVRGFGTFTYDGTTIRTRPGQLYLAQADIPHAVGAITDHYLLSFGAPHRHVTAEDRMTQVATTEHR